MDRVNERHNRTLLTFNYFRKDRANLWSVSAEQSATGNLDLKGSKVIQPISAYSTPFITITLSRNMLNTK